MARRRHRAKFLLQKIFRSPLRFIEIRAQKGAISFAAKSLKIMVNFFANGGGTGDDDTMPLMFDFCRKKARRYFRKSAAGSPEGGIMPRALLLAAFRRNFATRGARAALDDMTSVKMRASLHDIEERDDCSGAAFAAFLQNGARSTASLNTDLQFLVRGFIRAATEYYT